MTKDEAIEQMKKGIKVTHKRFLKDEWMAMTPLGHIVFEDGFMCAPNRFWKLRTSEDWRDGYSLYKDED